MNLVVGATGRLGSEICRLFAAKGEPIRALVRPSADPTKVRALRELGADLVPGDLRDPTSLATACHDVTAVIATASTVPFAYVANTNDIAAVDLTGLTRLITATQVADVPRFVFTSLSGNLDRAFPLLDAKRAIEQHLQDSGLLYTIVRPSFVSDVWLSPAMGFDYDTAKVRVYGSGQKPIRWISHRDVAQVVVDYLDHPAAHYATFELGGPEALSPLQVIEIFEEVGGRAFTVEHVPVAALEQQLARATDPLQQSLVRLMLGYAQGDPTEAHPTPPWLSPRLTSVRDYARVALGRQG